MKEHDVRPEFFDVVSSFYHKTLNIEEALSLPLQVFLDTNSLEYMYVIKYPEENLRVGEEPWSIRQMAIYHQVRLQDRRSTIIMLTPCPTTVARTRLTHWVKTGQLPTASMGNVFEPSRILLTCYLDNWRSYMKYYESKTEQLSIRMLNIGLKTPNGVSTSDLADINYIESRLTPAQAVLTSIIKLCDDLETMTAEVKTLLPDAADAQWPRTLSNSRAKLIAFRSNSSVLLRKTANISQMLNSILTFRSQEIMKEQSERVLFLTTSTVDDSATVRVITAITLVFLSFTVVAAVMAMPLFYLDDSSRLVVSSSLWIYIAVAVPLTVVTLAY
ncbi:hypothetical protein M409DRAFT_21286 [Zasmidium cellare ATCC 36951]|uniref:CorA-like transporter domain-containing protein n=1 Tax=Zasmidium cellare ATCC 36951 TaxID=1080233 RepID=A0A6A6CST8_ZASCE|nr:uncharacterized protein M409DRAFT_21286 [Zasmidium cellare ATCC 36951]KAF2168536.1 hypothetical protein M409DRAFT_21286 [Zasmidium cellare ATCC 36951]